MKNATEFAKKFKKFRKSLPSAEIATSEHGVIGEVLYAHLLWNATAKQAMAAYKKLIAATVDLNDLRMNHIFESVELIGVNYPYAEDRAKRLKVVLNAIYRREHGVHILSLDGAGKRDVRDYFDTLEGITPFVSNRVCAVYYGVATMPVDDSTLAVLIANDLVHDQSSITDVASWLARQVKAEDICEFHARLHSWVETQPVPKPSKPEKKTTKKKSLAKKPAKKPAKKSVKKPAKKPVKKPAKKKAKKKTTAKKKLTKKTPRKKVVKKKTAKKKAT